MKWLFGILLTTSALAQAPIPIGWPSCANAERVRAEERLTRIYNEKLAMIEIEREVECSMTSRTPISAYALCLKNGERFMKVRMDVNFYCDSPKTRLRKTVYRFYN